VERHQRTTYNDGMERPSPELLHRIDAYNPNLLVACVVGDGEDLREIRNWRWTPRA
jgi:hypothetical protein